MSKFYAVAKGKNIGIYDNWDKCKINTNGFSGAIFKSFKTKKEAELFMLQNTQINNTIINDNTQINNKIVNDSIQTNNEIINDNLQIDNKIINDNIQITDNKIINVYTDGSCIGNGTTNSVGGIGIYFENTQYKNISKQIIDTTNNRCELIAILETLKIVGNDQHIIINTDSEYSIKGIQKINKRNKNCDLFDEIDKIIEKRKGKTIFNKVKGHSGIEDGNFFADKLAIEGSKII